MSSLDPLYTLRACQIPVAFEWLSYISTGYWSNMGVLSVVLKGQKMPCRSTSNETEISSGVSCGITGNVLLKAIGISDRPEVPTGGLLILLILYIVVTSLVFPVLVKSLEQEIDPAESCPSTEEQQAEANQKQALPSGDVSRHGIASSFSRAFRTKPRRDVGGESWVKRYIGKSPPTSAVILCMAGGVAAALVGVVLSLKGLKSESPVDQTKPLQTHIGGTPTVDDCFGASESAICFAQGVASGDPTSDGFVIWTRVEPSCCRNTTACATSWAVHDAAGRSVAEGTAHAAEDDDYTLNIEVAGLAGGNYSYVFELTTSPGAQAGRQCSRVGQTRTLQSNLASVRLAHTSCSSYEHGHFHVYEEMARMLEVGELDAWTHVGDFIYE